MSYTHHNTPVNILIMMRGTHHTAAKELIEEHYLYCRAFSDHIHNDAQECYLKHSFTAYREKSNSTKFALKQCTEFIHTTQMP
jgi:hypothetical protein